MPGTPGAWDRAEHLSPSLRRAERAPQQDGRAERPRDLAERAKVALAPPSGRPGASQASLLPLQRWLDPPIAVPRVAVPRVAVPDVAVPRVPRVAVPHVAVPRVAVPGVGVPRVAAQRVAARSK